MGCRSARYKKAKRTSRAALHQIFRHVATRLLSSSKNHITDYPLGFSRLHHAHMCWDRHSSTRGARTMGCVLRACRRHRDATSERRGVPWNCTSCTCLCGRLAAWAKHGGIRPSYFLREFRYLSYLKRKVDFVFFFSRERHVNRIESARNRLCGRRQSARAIFDLADK